MSGVKGMRRRSKFDPYISIISESLAMGMSVREVADKLDLISDDYTDESALYAFIQSRGLRCEKFSGGLNRNYIVKKCENCDHCYCITGTNNQQMKVCGEASRIVPKSVKTSPSWCYMRKG